MPAWAAYVVAGAVAAVLIGPTSCSCCLACGAVELARRRATSVPLPCWLVGPATMSAAGYGALAWTAVKVGALSFGGGFVIIPLMQGDAVHVYHWMTNAQFLNAVALGQITPGPVVATIAAVGYAAHGLGRRHLAAAIAFAPSFAFVLLAGRRFDGLRELPGPRAFLDGAGPAAIGAIGRAAVTLAGVLAETWQFGVLAGAVIALLVLNRGVVSPWSARRASGSSSRWPVPRFREIHRTFTTPRAARLAWQRDASYSTRRCSGSCDTPTPRTAPRTTSAR